MTEKIKSPEQIRAEQTKAAEAEVKQTLSDKIGGSFFNSLVKFTQDNNKKGYDNETEGLSLSDIYKRVFKVCLSDIYWSFERQDDKEEQSKMAACFYNQATNFYEKNLPFVAAKVLFSKPELILELPFFMAETVTVFDFAKGRSTEMKAGRWFSSRTGIEGKEVIDFTDALKLEFKNSEGTFLLSEKEGGLSEANWKWLYQKTSASTGSCMIKIPDIARCYADNPDLDAIYTLDKNGKTVTGRTIIRRDNNTYIRIYSIDHSTHLKIQKRCNAMNLRENRNLKGVKLKYIEKDADNLFIPYVDGDAAYLHQKKSESGYYFEVSDTSRTGSKPVPVYSRTSSGVLRKLKECSSCGSFGVHIYTRQMINIETEELHEKEVCNKCQDNHFTFYRDEGVCTVDLKDVYGKKGYSVVTVRAHGTFFAKNEYLEKHFEKIDESVFPATVINRNLWDQNKSQHSPVALFVPLYEEKRNVLKDYKGRNISKHYAGRLLWDAHLVELEQEGILYYSSKDEDANNALRSALLSGNSKPAKFRSLSKWLIHIGVWTQEKVDALMLEYPSLKPTEIPETTQVVEGKYSVKKQLTDKGVVEYIFDWNEALVKNQNKLFSSQVESAVNELDEFLKSLNALEVYKLAA